MCERCEDCGTMCDDCCEQLGFEDGRDGEPRHNEFKNWSQANAYNDGYDRGLRGE